MRQGRIISFRVTEEHYALLVARSSKGGSPGSYARELMLQALHAEYVVEGIATRLDRQEDQVTAVRRDLRSVLRATLVAFARLDPEQARVWVERTLR